MVNPASRPPKDEYCFKIRYTEKGRTYTVTYTDRQSYAAKLSKLHARSPSVGAIRFAATYRLETVDIKDLV